MLSQATIEIAWAAVMAADHSYMTGQYGEHEIQCAAAHEIIDAENSPFLRVYNSDVWDGANPHGLGGWQEVDDQVVLYRKRWHGFQDFSTFQKENAEDFSVQMPGTLGFALTEDSLRSGNLHHSQEAWTQYIPPTTGSVRGIYSGDNVHGNAGRGSNMRNNLFDIISMHTVAGPWREILENGDSEQTRPLGPAALEFLESYLAHHIRIVEPDAYMGAPNSSSV